MPITDAISEAIRTHPESTISALAGIAGTLLGGVGGYLLDEWKSRGTVTVMPVELVWSWEGVGTGGLQSADGPESAKQVSFSFGLRVLNSHPIPKSLALVSVEFHPERRRFQKTEPLLSDPFKMIGTEWKETGRKDVQLPAHSFTRVYLSGAGVTKEMDPAKRTEILKRWRNARIEFLVSPDKRLVYWHHFPDTYLPREKKTPQVTMR